MKKSLKDISWQVSEEVYRQDPALSYSTLAKYERSGFNELEHLFDRVETPSLTYGSAVDSLLTEGQQEFDDRFIVAEFPSIPDSIIKIVKSLFNQCSGEYSRLVDIPDNRIIRETESQNYQANWKPETRAKVIKEKGADYYNLLFIAGDKTIIDTQTYNDVLNAVKALKESEATKFYFAEDNPFEPDIERLYQLKFKGTFVGITYRNMADLIVVDYKKKLIIPIDLKTSSHTEWDFYKSFVDWSYHVQSRLYWRIIRQNMDKDEYFKDFELADYRFIVVNRKTLTPLVWRFHNTQTYGTLYFGKNNKIVMRDPFTIGDELDTYLKEHHNVPIGINTTEDNNLEEWLNTL